MFERVEIQYVDNKPARAIVWDNQGNQVEMPIGDYGAVTRNGERMVDYYMVRQPEM